MRPTTRALVAFSLAVAFSVPGCAFMRAENRRLMNLADEGVQNTFVTNYTAGQIAAAPVFIPVGLVTFVVDAVLIHPACSIPPALEDTSSAVWKNPQGSDFRQMMLFLPKVVGTPVCFVGDWLFRCVFDVRC